MLTMGRPVIISGDITKGSLIKVKFTDVVFAF